MLPSDTQLRKEIELIKERKFGEADLMLVRDENEEWEDKKKREYYKRE